MGKNTLFFYFFEGSFRFLYSLLITIYLGQNNVLIFLFLCLIFSLKMHLKIGYL